MKHEIITAENEPAELEVISSNWDFTVKQEPLFLSNGTQAPSFANVRQDTGEVLGVVSERYTILQNRDLIPTAETLFRNSGLRFLNHGVFVSNQGAQVRAKYRFPDLDLNLNGQSIQFVLQVQNSFDGSLKVAFDLGLFRMLCTNGMKIPAFKGSTISLMRKHTESISLSFASGALQTAIESFKKSGGFFNALMQTRLTQTQGHHALNGLVTRKAIASRMADKVREIWDKPTFVEDADRNAFNLLNSVTQHLTHEVAPKRFNLSERIGQQVANEMLRAQRDGFESLFVSALPNSDLN